MLRTIASVNTSIFGKKDDTDNSNITTMSANKITLAEFREKLGKYPALIKTFTKPGLFPFFINGIRN
jgi:hypothetical protein